MKELNNIIKSAKKALDALENGKTFSSAYVSGRLENAAEKYSSDALICHMRDVIKKKASVSPFVTQREIAGLYDSLYGMGGGRSEFRNELGDLLPEKHASAELRTVDVSASRIPYENKMDTMYEKTELSDELSNVFDLNRTSSFAALSDNAVKRAEKYTKLQLFAMGYDPKSVVAVKTNDHFILCNASIDTSDTMQVSVQVPVQVVNGDPLMPAQFIDNGNLVKLNKENLYVFIKDKNNFKKKATLDSFVGQRTAREFTVDTPFLPASLEKYAQLETDLISAGSHFKPDQIKFASAVVGTEIGSFVKNAQIKVCSTTAKTITFDVGVQTSSGIVGIKIPVDMPAGQPNIPSHFVHNDTEYKINESSFRKVVASGATQKSLQKVSREVEEMSLLSYHQLVDRIISGVSDGDYKVAEDALSTIGSKFASEQYLAAFDKFKQLLKHSSSNAERDALIKSAMQKGDLIRVPTSVELYCPKLGLPASKVDFDAKGRPIPARRAAQSENLEESGAAISSYRITLS